MSNLDWTAATAPGGTPKITSIFDFSAESLGQLKVWLEQSGLVLPASSVTGSGIHTYTPVWSCQTGVQPSLGNGVFNLARYSRVGNTVSVTVQMTMGSTTTFGAGIYNMTLPIAVVSGAAQSVIGTFQVSDDSANSVWTGTSQVTADLVNVSFIFTAAAGGYAVNPTNPFTFAQNDKIKMSVVYQTES